MDRNATRQASGGGEIGYAPRRERQYARSAMGTVHYIGKSFDPAATHAMRVAFDNAWRDLEASGSNFSSRFPADRACERIAKRITDMVQRGERDTERLGKDAFAYLARRTALHRGQRR